jgi:hypothetical protein
MKLPCIWPVVFFAGGILLSGALTGDLHPSVAPHIALLAAAFLLLCAWVMLSRRRLLPAALLAATAWLCLGFAAAGFERLAVPSNLASSLIESGKLDSSVALRWRGRLSADPLQLPWGTRYELHLDQVES